MSPIPVDGVLDFQNTSNVINVVDPTNAQDVATKHYVDGAMQGVQWKDAVDAVAGSNVNLASPGEIATGPGRVLLIVQDTQSQNGIWVYTDAVTPLTRPEDWAAGSTQQPGAGVFDENSSTVYVMNTADAVIVDTTASTWTSIGSAASYTFVAPLTQDGQNVRLNNGDPLDLSDGGTGAATASAARTNLGAAGKYASTVGDAASTSFAVIHNLGTSDVVVNVYDMATGSQELVQTVITDVNTVTVSFSTAPATASGTMGSGTGKRVVVVG